MELGGGGVKQIVQIYEEIDLLLLGVGLLVIGTSVSAVGATKVWITNDDSSLILVAHGNEIEGTGNALQALSRQQEMDGNSVEKDLLSITGCWLQFSGNMANSVANRMIVREERTEGLRLNTTGSGVQSVGAYMEAIGEREGHILEREGNFLISLGSSFDAISNIYLLQEKRFIGNLIAAVGSYFELYGSITEFRGVYNDRMEKKRGSQEELKGEYSYTYTSYNQKK